MKTISIPYPDDIDDYFSAFYQQSHAILLQSGGDNDAAKISFFSAQPRLLHSCDIENIGSIEGKKALQSLKNTLQTSLDQFSNDTNDVFSCGWIGYTNYEFGQAGSQKTAQAPNFWAGFYDWAVIVDHDQHTAELIYLDCLSTARLHSIKVELQHCYASNNEKPLKHIDRSKFYSSGFTSLTSLKQYQADFSRIQDYLASGDCYQINYAQAFQADYSGDTYQAYRQLSQAVPSPFMAYINHPEHSILSISPERLVSINKQMMRSSPIKGTETRSSNGKKDKELATQLQKSDKNRAENLMIVDLIRNDLSKHAALGSIEVPELFSVESFNNVHHLVSHIDATLDNNSSALDVFFDTFPGGSITGAPKIRAMQIIKELEQQPRGIYCGSIFYASCNKNFDANIAIRTLSCNKSNHTITAWAGGAIVSDSKVKEEYQECKYKIDAFLNAITADK